MKMGCNYQLRTSTTLNLSSDPIMYNINVLNEPNMYNFLELYIAFLI